MMGGAFPFVVLDRQVLFTFDEAVENAIDIAQYDVAPDDQRFLTYRAPAIGQASGGVIVVENLIEESRAKVGN